jgi:hypothetical protein
MEQGVRAGKPRSRISRGRISGGANASRTFPDPVQCSGARPPARVDIWMLRRPETLCR